MATVAASGDGNAPSTVANTKNDGGVVFAAGNADTANGPITRNFTLQESTDGVQTTSNKYGSQMVEVGGSGAATTDRAGVTKAVAAGTLGFVPNATQWLIVGGNHTSTIGGVANTVMQGGGTDYNGQATTRSSIYGTLSTYKLGAGNGTFDVYAVPSTDITPNYTHGAGAGTQATYVSTSGDHVAVDDAANPTRSVPGELTYIDGSPNPINDEYKASDVFEA